MSLNRIKPKELKKFGITLAVMLLAIGTVHFWKGSARISAYFYISSAAFLVVSILLTNCLLPIYVVFSKIGKAIGWLNTRLLLIIIFYFIVTPIGLLMRLFRNNPLSLDIEKDKESYWVKKDAAKAAGYEKQF